MFAARLGSRRIGFQGDHYDIDIDTREIAIELGATACDSRELVRRLRGAGLRLRPSTFVKWSLVQRWDDVAGADAVLAEPRIPASIRALAAELDVDEWGAVVRGGFQLQRGASTALVLHGTGSPPPVDEVPEHGVHHRIDRFGRWGVELIDPPLRHEE